jgi:23S rRNA (uracil1939-C5)-methyltransferase
MTYPEPLFIESVDHEARGVAHHGGKVIFVDGGLPGELLTAAPYRKKERFDNAQISAIVQPSSSRVQPRCAHFGMCGGCSMQHAQLRTQVAIKQRVLEDNLRHIGRVTPEQMLRPIEGPAWEYRYRARLSVRHVHKKGAVLVGFHERRSSYVADMRECHVLPRRIAALLMPLRELVAGLSIRDRMPQVEVALGSRVDAAKLEDILMDVMNLTPRGIRTHLNLNRPIYARTSSYGHFGRPADADGGFSWERTDLAEAIKKAL